MTPTPESVEEALKYAESRPTDGLDGYPGESADYDRFRALATELRRLRKVTQELAGALENADRLCVEALDLDDDVEPRATIRAALSRARGKDL